LAKNGSFGFARVSACAVGAKPNVPFVRWLFSLSDNVPPLGEVANFVTDYFPLKIKFLAERKREFTTKFAIASKGC
jgi:hypothetical protein